ncbi:MAG: hypothetical protein KF788_15185 [Piscinibacter sp.]|nr:hypothetical protein [Piscinibacter sp.]
MATRRQPPGGSGARRLGAARERAKSMPAARALLPSSGSVTLEELLVGFQKSLARATRASFETARADYEVGLGQRSLYVIDGIGINLAAGVSAGRDAGGQVQAITLDLGEADPERASRLEFRVQARPIDAIDGEQLVLADLDPLGLQRPRHALRLTLIGLASEDQPAVRSSAEIERAAASASRALDAPAARGAVRAAARPGGAWVPLPHRPVVLFLVGADGEGETFALTTNQVGQVDVEIDAQANRIASLGRQAALGKLDLAARDDEFFVYASAELAGAGGEPHRLVSNVLQFAVKRSAPPPAKKR